MKTIALFLAGILSATTHAAVSDILFATGGATFDGAPGNVIYNSSHFVTPIVRTNGAIQLTFLDTNGAIVSNLSLSITGSSPRLLRSGSDYLLAWLNTNDVPNILAAARISQGTTGAISLLATNVADETVSLSAAAGQVLAVWQTVGSNSTVLARALDSSATPVGNIFPISSSSQPQRYPSVDNDGTNYLVAWMEQNIASNDWRVVAQRITNGALNGSPTQVSETNSMRPYATACSFGTNYLVAWSADEGPWIVSSNFVLLGGATNWWRPTVHVRMLSETATPLRHEFSILRGVNYNTNVVVAFGSRGYIAACYTWDTLQSVQPLLADGTPREHPFTVRDYPFGFSELRPRIATAGDRYCLLYQAALSNAWGRANSSVILAPKSIPELRLTNIRRTNDSIAVDMTYGYGSVQISTNMIDWEWIYVWQLPSLSGKPRLFVRQSEPAWECINNLRFIDRAKRDWAFQHLHSWNSGSPSASDLFGSPSLMPKCPFGSYSIHAVSDYPTCTVGGHTL